MRSTIMRETLLQNDPNDCVVLIARSIQLLRRFRSRIFVLYQSLAIVLHTWQGTNRRDIEDLCEFAIENNLDYVALLLDPHVEDHAVEDRGDGHLLAMTLGMQKSKARCANVGTIESYFGLQHRQVAEILLQNPYMSEKMAIRYAARRPQSYGLGEALMHNRRWLQIGDVVNAYVMNATADSRVRRLLMPLVDRETCHSVVDSTVRPNRASRLAEYLLNIE